LAGDCTASIVADLAGTTDRSTCTTMVEVVLCVYTTCSTASKTHLTGDLTNSIGAEFTGLAGISTATTMSAIVSSVDAGSIAGCRGLQWTGDRAASVDTALTRSAGVATTAAVSAIGLRVNALFVTGKAVSGTTANTLLAGLSTGALDPTAATVLIVVFCVHTPTRTGCRRGCGAGKNTLASIAEFP
jgi:hypothetical protein